MGETLGGPKACHKSSRRQTAEQGEIILFIDVMIPFLQASVAVRAGERRRRVQAHRGRLHVVTGGLRALVQHFVDCRLLITRARDDVLVVGRDVAAQHGRRFFRLKWRKVGVSCCFFRIERKSGAMK